MKTGKSRLWLFLLLIGGFLAGCSRPNAMAPTSTPDGAFTGDALTLRFVDPPETLCRDATQMRLQPVLEGQWPDGAVATWDVSREGEIAVIVSGTWTPQTRGLYVAFPEGEPLVPGDYRLVVSVGETLMAEQVFAIRGVGPQLHSVSPALSPSGPTRTDFMERPHVVYLRYLYEGACPGAPLWVTVRHAGEAVCNRNLTLQAESGEDAVACYRDDGAVMEAGVYTATLTLGGAETQLTFHLGVEPTPTPTPDVIVPKPVCEPPFAAVALTPEEDPYRPQERFEWYTQSVYVGARCQGLPSGLFWVIRWHRNGEEVRAYRTRWHGGEAGVLWDALTGTEEAPFLPPGVYTATLALEDEPPAQVGFRVVAYQPQE